MISPRNSYPAKQLSSDEIYFRRFSFAMRFATEYSRCVMTSVLRLFQRTMHGMQQNPKHFVSVECDIRSNIKREIIRERPLGKLLPALLGKNFNPTSDNETF